MGTTKRQAAAAAAAAPLAKPAHRAYTTFFSARCLSWDVLASLVALLASGYQLQRGIDAAAGCNGTIHAVSPSTFRWSSGQLFSSLLRTMTTPATAAGRTPCSATSQYYACSRHGAGLQQLQAAAVPLSRLAEYPCSASTTARSWYTLTGGPSLAMALLSDPQRRAYFEPGQAVAVLLALLQLLFFCTAAVAVLAQRYRGSKGRQASGQLHHASQHSNAAATAVIAAVGERLAEGASQPAQTEPVAVPQAAKPLPAAAGPAAQMQQPAAARQEPLPNWAVQWRTRVLVARQLLVHAALVLSTLLLPRPRHLVWMTVASAHSSAGGSCFYWPYLALSVYSMVSPVHAGPMAVAPS